MHRSFWVMDIKQGTLICGWRDSCFSSSSSPASGFSMLLFAVGQLVSALMEKHWASAASKIYRKLHSHCQLLLTILWSQSRWKQAEACTALKLVHTRPRALLLSQHTGTLPSPPLIPFWSSVGTRNHAVMPFLGARRDGKHTQEHKRRGNRRLEGVRGDRLGRGVLP